MSRIDRLAKNLLLVCASLLVSACAWFGEEEEDEFASLSTEEQFYQQALDQLTSRNYLRAIATYEALESRFPFGRFAEQAQIEIVYAYFSSGDREAARAAAERFIRLHPDSENIDYAHYMLGLSSFEDNSSLIDRLIPIDHTKRDPGRTKESFSDFAQLLALYPDSPYSADARARMIYLRNNLAAHEIHVANYYLERRAYIAAQRRAQHVVENFQGTPAVSDAVAIMVECYLRLGLNDLADTSLALLRENYPDHPSLDGNGEFLIRTEISDPSLLYTVSFGLLGDNRSDPPLAPTSRPPLSGSEQIINSQNPQEDVREPGRSLLSIITFGIFD